MSVTNTESGRRASRRLREMAWVATAVVAVLLSLLFAGFGNQPQAVSEAVLAKESVCVREELLRVLGAPGRSAPLTYRELRTAQSTCAPSALLEAQRRVLETPERLRQEREHRIETRE